MRRIIYCCKCEDNVEARLVTGKEVYPHRKDLHELPFWRCPHCGNHVGCHHKTKKPTKPLGCIPTKELRNARRHIHQLVDPLWKQKLISRSGLYKRIAKEAGMGEFHTAELRTIDECRVVYYIALQIAKEVRYEGNKHH